MFLRQWGQLAWAVLIVTTFRVAAAGSAAPVVVDVFVGGEEGYPA